MNANTDKLLEKANALLERLERLLPSAVSVEPDWQQANAFRWEQGRLAPVSHPHRIGLTDLL
ncbi:MAG: AAA family ATPase, partial [Gallionella sp.]